MNKNEIEEIKTTVFEESKEKIDPLEGDMLANLGEQEGWRIMMKKANKKISELLEPIPHSEILEVKDLALIGAMDIARTEKIEVLRWFISQVESEKKAKRQMAALKPQSGESEPKT